MKCNKCGTKLTNSNWYVSDRKSSHYICKECRRKYDIEHLSKYKDKKKECDIKSYRKRMNTFEGKWKIYNRSARKKKHVMKLTFDEFCAIVIQPCFYCGALPNKLNGVDRVENNIGYTWRNCIPCCRTCNMMKRNLSQKDFIDKCRMIAKNRKK